MTDKLPDGPSKALEKMTTEELAMLLIVSQPNESDRWFCDAIVDELKKRKPGDSDVDR